MIKDIVTGALRSGGLVIKRLPVDNLEENLRALFEALQINCVLDVGGHFGEYGRFLRKIGYRGRIVSFEPVKESYGLLCKTAAEHGDWVAYNFALGRAAAKMEINVSNNSVFTSFLEASEYSKQEFGAQPETARKETVEIVTADSVFARCVEGLEKPRVFMKLDTQGFDLEVVAGAAASMPSVLGMQSELSVRQIYQQMPDWMEAIAAYKALGYEVSGLYPVNRDRDWCVIEFDCVMRRVR